MREKTVMRMDNFNIKKKLQIFYIFCVLLPLILTDSVIFYIIGQANRDSTKYEMENIAAAVQYNLINTVESMSVISKNIYVNPYINQFLNQQHDSALDYYNSYLELMKDTLFESSLGTNDAKITMYADNDTIINGGKFVRLSREKNSEWYEYLVDSDKNAVLYFYYDDSRRVTADPKRKVSFIRKLNYYQRDSIEKVLKIDINYNSMVWNLVNMKYGTAVYVCWDDRILLSNNGYSTETKDFEVFNNHKDVGLKRSINIYGQPIDIYVMKMDMGIQKQLKKNLPLIFLLIIVNGFLPWLLMRSINKSFTSRLRELCTTFEMVEEEKLMHTQRVWGTDEIGELMQNYNKMAARINGLVQTVYKDKLKEQEMDIARQNAELLALHSQINSHFLFNALENIRMHSLLKKEHETAHMVEMLAVMERQYVDWGNDSVTIQEEMNFVKAYLELQKYRFGERLSYELEVGQECNGYYIPKLTLVTFVENACVHGFESKTGTGWVFVRAYLKQGWLRMEVEDTGKGMDINFLEELKRKMNEANIDHLKNKEKLHGGVGIVNACLRLKMVTNNRVQFDVESEEGIGTIIILKIPVSCFATPNSEGERRC